MRRRISNRLLTEMIIEEAVNQVSFVKQIQNFVLDQINSLAGIPNWVKKQMRKYINGLNFNPSYWLEQFQAKHMDTIRKIAKTTGNSSKLLNLKRMNPNKLRGWLKSKGLSDTAIDNFMTILSNL